MACPIPLQQFPVYSKANLPGKNADYTTGGIFLLDKPQGWTSFRVVGLLRKLIRVKKVGHAGTLDPMAGGLLILCSGRATKSISLIQDMPKVYRAVVTFGFSTPSYDSETPPDAKAPYDHLTESGVRKELDEHFTGEIEQRAPMYSAVKHQGKRLYKLARQGIEVERSPRRVWIHEIRMEDYSPPDLSISITCSKGTYIRSIAHDLGLALNSRACLTRLSRTKTGKFDLDLALTVSDLTGIFEKNDSADLSE